MKLGPLRLAVIGLTLATALIHLLLIPGDLLFTLNAAGYVALLLVLLLPVAALAPYRGLARWALMAFAALTIVLWIAMGARTPLGYLDKLIEAALIVVLYLDGRRANA